MELQELVRRVTKLQACVRGRQTRRRLRDLRAEYEEVVRQVEGEPAGRLRWEGRWLPRPVFSPEPRVSPGEAPVRLRGGGRGAAAARAPVPALLPPPGAGRREGVVWDLPPLPLRRGPVAAGTEAAAASAQLGNNRRETEAGRGRNRKLAPPPRRAWPRSAPNQVAPLPHPVLGPTQGGRGAPAAVRTLPRPSFGRPHAGPPGQALPSQAAQLQRLRRHLAMEMLWLQQAIVSRKKAPLATRTLYTPKQGHVITDLSQLQSGGEYVAAGFERFRSYIYPGGEKPGRKNNRFPAPPILPRPNHRSPGKRIPASASCTIQVFRNGDLLSPPFSLHLPLTSHQGWESVLRQLTKKAKLKGGAVTRLCTLEGVPVLSRGALVNGGYYVAVSEEEYKALPYLELLVPSPSLPGGFWYPPRLEPRAHRQKAESFRDAVAQLSRKESSISFVRPMLDQPHLRKHPILKSGERGVYGAPLTRKELVGAQEVEEDETTLTEVPLDQRAAEMVEEACFSENAA